MRNNVQKILNRRINKYFLLIITRCLIILFFSTFLLQCFFMGEEHLAKNAFPVKVILINQTTRTITRICIKILPDGDEDHSFGSAGEVNIKPGETDIMKMTRSSFDFIKEKQYVLSYSTNDGKDISINGSELSITANTEKMNVIILINK